MRFVGTLMIFGGYIFIYAAVADSGRFATEPWASLYADAYTGQSSLATSSTPTTSTPAASSTTPAASSPATANTTTTSG